MGKIRNILDVYEKSLSHMVNQQKFLIYFNSNTPTSSKQDIIKEAGGVLCGNYYTYLGLSAMIGRSKYNTFRWLNERIWQKVTNWKYKFLSQAKKEIIIKAVLQVILVYTMRLFCLTNVLCKEIEAKLANF